MEARDNKTPAIVVGTVVAAVIALALIVRHNQDTPVVQQDAAAAIATADERPIPASPWQSELAKAPGDSGALQFATETAMGQSAGDIGTAAAAAAAGQAAGAAASQAGDVMHAMRIDGSSLDAMVDSINRITASLPEDDARAFQKAVRVLMVASLPIDKLRAQKVAIDKLPPEQLIAGAQRVLAGRTPLQVLTMAQARIDAELARRAKGYGQEPGLPTSELQVAR